MKTAKEIKERLFDEELFNTAIEDVEIAVETAMKNGDDYAFCAVDVRVCNEVVADAKASGYTVYCCRTILGSVLYVFAWGETYFTEYPEV